MAKFKTCFVLYEAQSYVCHNSSNMGLENTPHISVFNVFKWTILVMK